MIKSLFPNEVKGKITVDDISLRSNLTANKTIKFPKKSFFYRFLDFTQSYLGPLNDPPKSFIQLLTVKNLLLLKNLIIILDAIKFV